MQRPYYDSLKGCTSYVEESIALTLPLSHGARENLPFLSYDKIMKEKDVARPPSPRGKGTG